MSDRCYGCSQENCDTRPCTCWCHTREHPIEETPCSRCGALGAHYCVGKRPSCDPFRWDLEREIDLEVFRQLDGGPKCKRHRQYRALRRPRTACEACWRRWIALHPA